MNDRGDHFSVKNQSGKAMTANAIPSIRTDIIGRDKEQRSLVLQDLNLMELIEDQTKPGFRGFVLVFKNLVFFG